MFFVKQKRNRFDRLLIFCSLVLGKIIVVQEMKKIGYWLLGIFVVAPVALFSLVLLLILVKQDAIIQSQITTMNHEHQGLVKVGDTHLDPFINFPHTSVKIDEVEVFETKADDAPIILEVADIYVGFSILDLLQGNFDIRSLIIEEGFLNIVLHEDGLTNLQNALANPEAIEEDSEPLSIHLKSIEFRNVDIHKLDESTQVDVETFFTGLKVVLKRKMILSKLMLIQNLS